MTICESALTTPQREVVALLLKGLSNVEIAARRRVSEQAIKNQLNCLYGRFQIRGGIPRIKLAVLLHRNGCEAAD